MRISLIRFLILSLSKDGNVRVGFYLAGQSSSFWSSAEPMTI